MTNKTEVKALTVKELLEDSSPYIIPIYQRNYAWGEAEITQLVQDIADSFLSKSDERKNYYIGTLVVDKRKQNNGQNSFEIIDGQQRFTTLSLLVIYLKNQCQGELLLGEMVWYKKPNIQFDSRPNSTQTFSELRKLDGLIVNKEHLNQDILKGYDLIGTALKKLVNNDNTSAVSISEFIDYLLNSVKIMRVLVPKKTDLNHYFEVMNNRGEQLEKHEILKANMMSTLKNDATAQNVLQKVWESCANMDRYVQYGFSTTERTKIFGDKWGDFKPKNFEKLVECIDSVAQEETQESSESLLAIIGDNRFTKSEDKTVKKEESSVDRFSSIVDFPNFLLQVLRVNNRQDTSLDDKQLIPQFACSILNDAGKVKQFIFALLKAKYMFDQFIIKRDYSKDNDNWHLLRLKYYDSKNVSYVHTFDDKGKTDGINKNILMLLSAFHVSAPTMSYKHWLNATLVFLCKQEVVDPEDYLKYLSNIAQRFMFERYLASSEAKSYFTMIYSANHNYRPTINVYHSNSHYQPINSYRCNLQHKLRYGDIRNNFVFNYLDYLLWLKNKDTDAVYKNFVFTARSSVEHFQPQNPIKEEMEITENSLHNFGNLCLIGHSKNSRLSNFQPKSKVEYFTVEIDKNKIESLKLYEMIKLLNNSEKWGDEKINQHNTAMLDILLQFE